MIAQLDSIFPMLVFVYGAVMVMVTHSKTLEQQARKQMDASMVDWFYSHRLLGRICFFVGFLWTLQRLRLL